MRVGIPKEIRPGEKRVAATPETVERLRAVGYECRVEAGAGARADFPDAAYREAGAEIVDDRAAVWSEVDLVLKIQPPREAPELGAHEVDLLGEQTILVGLLWPDQNEQLIRNIADRGATAFALDAVPRITRAQSMDVQSSMAGIAGYRAVVEAANEFGRFFNAQITAAGSTPPARVVVVGAGVAGLQAVATAGDMGASVYAFDTREAVRDEVESLGGNFLEFEFDESGEGEGGYAKEMTDAFLESERRFFIEEAEETDIFISTAAVPGSEAPTLLMEEAIEAMPEGGVVVDLAAEQGGNCELTELGRTVERHGVRILGPENLTSRLPNHASHYFGRNVGNFLELFGGAEEFEIDEGDRIVREMMVAREGEVTWPPPEFEDPSSEPPSVPDDTTGESEGGAPAERRGGADDAGALEERTSPATIAAVVAAVLFFGIVGLYAPPDFVQHFTVFVLSCFVGWQVVWNVTPSLHTPLMSVTNAVSGIIIVGGLIVQASAGGAFYVTLLATAAVLVASINIFGGFLVTQRMLGMFRAEDETDGEGA